MKVTRIFAPEAAIPNILEERVRLYEKSEEVKVIPDNTLKQVVVMTGDEKYFSKYIPSMTYQQNEMRNSAEWIEAHQNYDLKTRARLLSDYFDWQGKIDQRVHR